MFIVRLFTSCLLFGLIIAVGCFSNISAPNDDPIDAGQENRSDTKSTMSSTANDLEFSLNKLEYDSSIIPITNPYALPSPPDPVPIFISDETEVDQDASIDLGLMSEPSTVLVIFDKSGSMANNWDGTMNKWAAAGKALTDALTPLQDFLTVGAIFFPQPSDCAVAEIDSGKQIDFMSGSTFIENWNEVVIANIPNGNTPLESAFKVADRAIAQVRDTSLDNGRFQVILLTDGEPNCETDLGNLGELPGHWLSQGIQTYVLGLPGSSGAAELLDSIAKAGGTECHSAPGNPDELQNEITAILL